MFTVTDFVSIIDFHILIFSGVIGRNSRRLTWMSPSGLVKLNI